MLKLEASKLFVHLSELCIGAKDFEPNVETISIASEQEVRF